MIVIYFLITLGVFFFMEGVAWFTHRYIMHGFLWYLHEDHHQPGYPHVFERNDAFFLIFATPSTLFLFFGAEAEFNFLFFIGLGILLYGLCYFLVHDVLIHRRFKWLDNIKNPYFRALRKAHKVHHKNMGKEDCECFGMLWVPLRYYKEAWDTVK